jgi:hypothetical protein
MKYAYSYITETSDKSHINMKFDVEEPRSTTSPNNKDRSCTQRKGKCSNQ